MNYTPKPIEWFTDRIGKKIYRDCQNKDHDKECRTCKVVTDQGLVVHNKDHAEYLAAVDADFAAEGIESNYRDEL